jgi:hypothetical protein
VTLSPPTPTARETELLLTPRLFRISPLIRITLLLLYLALTFPLPLLAQVTAAPVSPRWLTGGLLLGWVILWGALSEQVVLDEVGIAVTYPRWAQVIWRRSWQLRWSEIASLKPRSTGQGGLVYYFLTEAGDVAYLLPMRVAGFAALVGIVEAKTGIDTQDVRPLAQPWMYLILLGFTLLLLAMDGWVVSTAIAGGFPLSPNLMA